MSTRGAYGFIINGREKITYNHSSSYPSYLGMAILDFIYSTPRAIIQEVAERIRLVDEEGKPTPDELHANGLIPKTSIHAQELDWYWALRDTQGNLSAYITNQQLHVMIDNASFLNDSLFCEWAYLINLDSMQLEIYKGWNESKDARGRYAQYHDTSANYGVALVSEFPIQEIQADRAKFYTKMLEVGKE